MSRLVNLRLDEGLLERVDAVAGPRGRTRFVTRALEAALDSPAGHGGAQGVQLPPADTADEGTARAGQSAYKGDPVAPVPAPPRASKGRDNPQLKELEEQGVVKPAARLVAPRQQNDLALARMKKLGL